MSSLSALGPLVRQRKTKAPCQGCGLGDLRCICGELPRLTLSTQVTLIIHHRELRRTTNTGRLALSVLEGSDLHVRGLKDSPREAKSLLLQERVPLLLFPADNAVELTADFCSSLTKPIQLIVPDGNWRQASKVGGRYAELAEVPRVFVRRRNTAKYFLRAESTPHGMSTLEAIAEALGVLEGEPVRNELLQVYRRKLEQTLKGRGVLGENQAFLD